jgi:DNA cross-link repair 1C protein
MLRPVMPMTHLDTHYLHRYLIEGSKGAVLHTGDMRAEPSFVENLKRNPFLAKYILPDPELDFRTEPASQDNSKHLYPTLEAIYLDTACLIGTVDVPTKVRSAISPARKKTRTIADACSNPQIAATSGLVQLMGLYPVTTRFFINIWTWGYEDILKAVSKAFGCKVRTILCRFLIEYFPSILVGPRRPL